MDPRFQHVKVATIPPPTYLSVFDVNDDLIDVILSSKGSKDVAPKNAPTLNLWNKSEDGHFPVTLQVARDYISTEYHGEYKRDVTGDKPMYVLCDGNNTELTIALGSLETPKKFMLSKITVLNPLPVYAGTVDLKCLEDRHAVNLRKPKCKIDCHTVFKYYLYGTFLPNCLDVGRCYSHNFCGNVSLEVTCDDKKCGLKLEHERSNINVLAAHVIAGHPFSSVHFLWKELCQLQFYMDTLNSLKGIEKQEEKDVVVLCPKNFDNYKNIQRRIDRILNASWYDRMTDMEVIIRELDLTNIRMETFLDKLYGILKECNTLGTLCHAVNYFFKELVESDILVKVISGSCTVAIAAKEVIAKKRIVSPVKCQQALEILLELGSEKLKNDYGAILGSILPSSETVISSIWNTIYDANLEWYDPSKLTYLGNLHLALEFMLLTKNYTKLADEELHYFNRQVFRTYAEERTEGDFIMLRKKPLRSLQIRLFNDVSYLIGKDFPWSWYLQMDSTCSQGIEVTTVYYLVTQPVFPTNVFNRYYLRADLPYYAYKMEKVVKRK